MIFSFDMDVAKEFGVNEAIMISNFQFWIEKNKANNIHFYDNHYWTYNSKKAFETLFPFWSEQNIKTILNHLKEKGVIITGNYNKNKYDKTLWYAFNDEEKWLKKSPIDTNDLTNQLDTDANRLVNSNQPIPDINTDINTDIKENNINTKSIYIQRKDKKDDTMCLGEFKNVKLTKEQVKKLIINYDWYFEDAIETLSSYLESKGNRYKSHYAVLSKHNWVWNKVHQDPECGQRPVCLMVPDPTQKGGLRKETALEYYTKKYNLQF